VSSHNVGASGSTGARASDGQSHGVIDAPVTTTVGPVPGER
jgi:hypothetical protein